jgi:hypothetical protein
MSLYTVLYIQLILESQRKLPMAKTITATHDWTSVIISWDFMTGGLRRTGHVITQILFSERGGPKNLPRHKAIKQLHTPA